MVGAITLALLAGFGTLVFHDRNRPLVAQTPTPTTQPSTPVIPSSPGTVPEPQPMTPPDTTSATTPPAATSPETPPASATPGTPTENGPASSTTAPQATTPAPAGTPATSQALNPADTATAPTPATSTPTPVQPTTPGLAQTSEIPPVPKAPPVEPIKPPVLTQTPPPASQAQPAAPTSDQPAATTTSEAAQTPATPAVPARAGGAVATSENRVPLRSDYRISLGSFTTRKTVESRTANVRGLGYTVHAIDLGDQYVAQIGPFTNEEEARRALADIQRAYPSALLYRPRNASAETTQASSPDGSASNAAPAPASTTETTPAPQQAAAPDGPRYLQVGAFDREESAQRLVGILHDNGFNPTVNSPEGRKTTVMVGPYSGDALLRAEARLDNAGLEHFRVR